MRSYSYLTVLDCPAFIAKRLYLTRMARSWTEVGVDKSGSVGVKQPWRLPPTQSDWGSTNASWIAPKESAESIKPTPGLTELSLTSSHCHTESSVRAPRSVALMPTSKSPLRDRNTLLIVAPETFFSVMVRVMSFSTGSGLAHTCVSWNFPSVVFLVTVRGNAPAVGCTNVGGPNPPSTSPVSWPRATLLKSLQTA